MDNTFYTQLIENDLNPFLLFDSSGKLKDFNKEAEFLLNFVKPKELYELAVYHASLNFGFKQKFIKIRYEKFKYYAILVGYISDDEIGLRLYKEVCTHNEIAKIKNIELTNIFSLIDLSKATTLFQSDIKIEEIYDVSIPNIKLNINEFLLILNECFSIFKNENHLILKVYIRTGEYEIIQEQRYKIMAIEFISKNDIYISDSLKEKLEKTYINLFYHNRIFNLELPMIL